MAVLLYKGIRTGIGPRGSICNMCLYAFVFRVCSFVRVLDTSDERACDCQCARRFRKRATQI